MSPLVHLEGRNQHEAFLKNIYYPYHQDVYQFCLFSTNSEEEAKDLTQETFIKALKNIEQFKGKSSLKTWIISIARNTTIDMYRKRKYQKILTYKWGKEESLKENYEMTFPEEGDWEVLQQSLNALKLDYRQVVILRALKEFSSKETAEILGWSEGKVRVTYFRALKKMRGSLDFSEEGIIKYERTK